MTEPSHDHAVHAPGGSQHQDDAGPPAASTAAESGRIEGAVPPGDIADPPPGVIPRGAPSRVATPGDAPQEDAPPSGRVRVREDVGAIANALAEAPQPQNPHDLADHIRRVMSVWGDRAWDHETRERAIELATELQVHMAQRVAMADPDCRHLLVEIRNLAPMSAFPASRLFSRALMDWMHALHVEELALLAGKPATPPAGTEE